MLSASLGVVHYMIFGDAGGSPEQLARLLSGTRENGLSVAFADTFGRSFSEVGDDLQDYISGGTYSMARIPLESIETREPGIQVSVAGGEEVLLGLARLAIGTGNLELAQTHIDGLLAIAPERPTTHDAHALLAVATRSRDAYTYRLLAQRLFAERLRGASSRPDEKLSALDAREIADTLTRAIDLSPYEFGTYEMFVDVLMSVESFTQSDSIVLANGERLFPDEAAFDVGQAIMARADEDPAAASGLMGAALDPDRRLSRELAQQARFLRDAWVLEDVLESVATFASARELESALAVVDMALADDVNAGQLRTTLERVRATVLADQRMGLAAEALESGRIAEAREILQSLAEAADVNPSLRREIRRRLEALEALE